jgi:sec-independent protein translocase protein TatA
VRPVDAEDNPMGSLSIWHWILVIGVAVLLFGGRGKISGLMGDVAQGIKAFKKGMQEDDAGASDSAKAEPTKTIDHQSANANASEVKTRSETTV